MSVRIATHADVPTIVAMGQVFLGDTAYRQMYLENVDQMRALATRIIEIPTGDFLLETTAAGTTVGMLAVIIFDHFISGQRAAGEVVYWVEPTARGCGVRLLKAAERWAKAQGAAFIQMVSPTPRVDQLYLRLGYAPVERLFQRPL